MLMTQLFLTRPFGEKLRGMATLTTWVESDKRLREGVWITLKGEDHKWLITRIYSEAELNQIDHRGWDNNNYDKHKGLFNAKSTS